MGFGLAFVSERTCRVSKCLYLAAFTKCKQRSYEVIHKGVR